MLARTGPDASRVGTSRRGEKIQKSASCARDETRRERRDATRATARRASIAVLRARREMSGATRRTEGSVAPGDSNMNVTTSPASSAFIVMMSSLPAHFNILDCASEERKRDRGASSAA
eukprot:30456-Pelagococcus_subviridis.AAC.5